jgi:hypothetical protein
MTTPYRSSPDQAPRLVARFHAELARELYPGERVLWTGVPRPWRLVRRAVGRVGFPLLWNCFALCLLYGAAKQGGILSFFAVPFLAVGLPLFRDPFDALRAVRSTFYAVTDRRALLFDGDEILTCARGKVANVRTRVRGDGSGDLWIVPRARNKEPLGLLGVRDARHVEALIRG